MSAIGTKRTSAFALHMSAFGGKADIVHGKRTHQMSAKGPKRTSWVAHKIGLSNYPFLGADASERLHASFVCSEFACRS